MLTLGFVKVTRGYVNFKNGGDLNPRRILIFDTIQSAFKFTIPSIHLVPHLTSHPSASTKIPSV